MKLPKVLVQYPFLQTFSSSSHSFISSSTTWNTNKEIKQAWTHTKINSLKIIALKHDLTIWIMVTLPWGRWVYSPFRQDRADCILNCLEVDKLRNKVPTLHPQNSSKQFLLHNPQWVTNICQDHRRARNTLMFYDLHLNEIKILLS